MSTRDEIKRVIAILQATFPAKKIDNLTVLVDAYWLGLKDLDMQHLEGALEALIREKTFFPAVAEIREYAEKYEKRKNSMCKISPQALREHAIKLKDRYIAGEDNLGEWFTLARGMRNNGQECAADALEREANGIRDNCDLFELVEFVDMLQKEKEVSNVC